MIPRPARYFPVVPEPLRMRPGLSRLGTDFGNGPRDGLYLQVDDQYLRYWQGKRLPRRPGDSPRWMGHGVLTECVGQERAHTAALDWLREAVEREAPPELRHDAAGVHPEYSSSDYPGWGAPSDDGSESTLTPYDSLLRNLQEDAVLMQRGEDGSTRAIMVHVCFPTGWRPEVALGQTFQSIHRPVPDFADRASTNRSMEDSMLERGPYVRFVWTVCADDELDRHPDSGTIRGWDSNARRGWLRVERQVTVPLSEVAACLFLIRVYLYPFTDLSSEQLGTITRAVEQTSSEVLHYKGLWHGRRAIIAALEQARHPQPD